MESVSTPAIFSSKQVSIIVLLESCVYTRYSRVMISSDLISRIFLQCWNHNLCYRSGYVSPKQSLLAKEDTTHSIFLQVVVTAIGASLVDKAGRKPLLLVIYISMLFFIDDHSR